MEQSLMDKLSTACLDCKIVLCKGNFRFPRVAILCDKITGITCQHHVIYLAFSAFWHWYRFADAGKMIGYIFTGIFSGFLRFFND